jgi:hypothetical protein
LYLEHVINGANAMRWSVVEACLNAIGSDGHYELWHAIFTAAINLRDEDLAYQWAVQDCFNAAVDG